MPIPSEALPVLPGPDVGVPGWQIPRAYALPQPPPPRGPSCTPCGQSAGSPRCPPLCAPSAGPLASIRLLRDAQHLHTEVGHLFWAQRTAPHSGAGHALRMPNEGHIVHCEINSVGAAGVEALLLGTGSPGSLVTWSTEPGSRLWSWGGVHAESSLTLLSGSPWVEAPCGFTSPGSKHPSWTLGHEDTQDPQRSVPIPRNSTRKDKKESSGDNERKKHLSTTQIRQGKAKNNLNLN